jgi:hypothetical protein
MCGHGRNGRPDHCLGPDELENLRSGHVNPPTLNVDIRRPRLSWAFDPVRPFEGLDGFLFGLLHAAVYARLAKFHERPVCLFHFLKCESPGLLLFAVGVLSSLAIFVDLRVFAHLES